MASCKKTWICTCSETLIGSPGTTSHQTYAITANTYKPVAQADCNEDCLDYLDSPYYKDQSAVITPQ